MPPVAAIVFKLLESYLPGMLEWLSKNLPILFAYLKGRSEQRTADKLKTLKTEARQSSEITERLEEIEKDEMSKIGKRKTAGGSDIYKPDPDKLRGPQPNH